MSYIYIYILGGGAEGSPVAGGGGGLTELTEQAVSKGN